MSLRVDSASLIAGALVCGNRGLGVLGADVPSSGDNGPGYLFNDLSLPADANREVRGLIVAPPAAGTFLAYEDSSFEFYGAPDGVYSFTYRLFVDGSDLGTADVELRVGTVTHDAGGALAGGGSVLSGAAAHVAVHAAAGAMSGSGAALAGVADHQAAQPPVGVHSTSGGLVGGGASMAGAAALQDGTPILTAEDIAAIANAVWAHPRALTVGKFLGLK